MLLLLDGLFSGRSIWASMQFKCNTPLLIFCLENLFTVESEVLKSPLTVLLPISPFKCVSYFSCIFKYSNVGCIHINNCYILLVSWPLHHYIMTFFVFKILFDIRIATSIFFWFQLAGNIFSICFLSICVLDFKICKYVCICVYMYIYIF